MFHRAADKVGWAGHETTPLSNPPPCVVQERSWLLEQEKKLNLEDAAEGEIDLMEVSH